MNPQDKATARPWEIHHHVSGLADYIIAKPNGHLTIIAQPFISEEQEANAALIVAAVNQFDALNKVAEAAENLFKTWKHVKGTGSPSENQSGMSPLIAGNKFKEALSALSAMRQEGAGK